MQRLKEERGRIERAYDQLQLKRLQLERGTEQFQDEDAQLKQANELKEAAVSMHAA